MNFLLKVISTFFLFVSPIFIYAEDKLLNENPIEIEADKFEYIGDQKTGKVIARGKVEAVQGNQKVYANFVEYDFQKDVLLAEDQVKILEEKGYIIEANKAILSDRLKFGSMDSFTIITPNKSTLKGKLAKKEKEHLIDVEKGFFTACKICPNKSTIWEITAKKAELDEDNDSVKYRDAVFKFYKVPVLYTPYFSHYTAKAKRRSGFLVPSYGGSTYLGTAVRVPYYFNIAPNQDATLSLLATSKRGPVVEAKHRYLLPQGQINSKGSITSAKDYYPTNQIKPKHDIRYFYNTSSELYINQRKNFGWDINNASDKNYRRDYNYGTEDYLTSKIYNQSYQDNGFYEIQTLSFQNLRPNDQSMNNTPLVLPLFESQHTIFNFKDKSHLNFESNLFKIHRYNGPDSNRLSIKNKWEKEALLGSGHKFNFFASLRNDVYYYEQAPVNNKNYTGTTSRTIPETGVRWSYPLTRYIGSTNVVIEPIVNAVATPYSKYNKKVFSEDSSNLGELTDGNLFAPSQYTGIDLVESTPRVGYGLKGLAYFKDNFNASALFGQMYRQKPQEFMAGSSQEHLSDYVGRLKFDFNDTLTLSYQYKLDKDTLINKTNELESTVRYKKAYFTTNLLYYRDNIIINQIKNRREIYLETGINNYNNISASVNVRKNLSSKKDNPDVYIDPNGFISTGAKLKYTNDCITYSANMEKDYTKNNNGKKSNTTYWFSISLKDLS